MSRVVAASSNSSRPDASSTDEEDAVAQLWRTRVELNESRDQLARLQAQVQRLQEQGTVAQPEPTQTATPTSESIESNADSRRSRAAGNNAEPATSSEEQQQEEEEGASSSNQESEPPVPHTSQDASPELPADLSSSDPPTGEHMPTDEHTTGESSAQDGSQRATDLPPHADDPAGLTIQTDSAETPPPDRSIPTDSAETPDWLYDAEDTSVPNDEELKEIEASNEVSARDVKYHEDLFYADAPDDPEQRPWHKMRLTWTIKGVRGTKNHPNRARIMHSPPAYVDGYYWYLKFFPRGNNCSSLSAYIKCSKKERKPDKEVPETTFSAVCGGADADLSELEPFMDVSIPATDRAGHQDSTVTSEDSTDDKASGKPPRDRSMPREETANRSDNRAEKPAVPKEEDGKGEEEQGRTEDDDSEDWRVPAQIGIIIYNPEEPRTNFDMAACHQFNKHNDDWGWTNFHGPWSDIHKRKRGQRRPLLQNDTIAIDAYIQTFNDPSQALWWSRSPTEDQWDSLSLSGYPAIGGRSYHSPAVAGITSWILLAPFRRIIDALPPHVAHTDSLLSELWLALFSLRHRGKDDKQQVSLTFLTKAMGRLGESGTDVVTFWEGFRRSMELELEALNVPTAIAQLSDIFDGSPSPEALSVRALPLRIPVKAVPSVQKGLEKALPETLSAQRFPKFLPIELERQIFDDKVRKWTLLYDRVRLDEEIDLSRWSIDGVVSKYTLYGFVVHQEDRASGDFYPVLRPSGPGTKWLAFADGSQVNSYTSHRIREFEGLEGSALAENKGCRQTAYLAMYIRTDLLKEFLPGKLESIELPQCLRDCSPLRNILRGRRMIGANEMGPSKTGLEGEIELRIYNSARVKDCHGLFDFDDLVHCSSTAAGKEIVDPSPGDDVKYLAVPVTTTVQQLRHKLTAWMEIENVEQIKIWSIQRPAPGRRLGYAFLPHTKLSDVLADLERPVHHIWMKVLTSPEDIQAFGDPEPELCDSVFKSASAEDERNEGEEGANEADPEGTVPEQAAESVETQQRTGTDAEGNGMLPLQSSLDDVSPESSGVPTADSHHEDESTEVERAIATAVSRQESSADTSADQDDMRTVSANQRDHMIEPIDDGGPGNTPVGSHATASGISEPAEVDDGSEAPMASTSDPSAPETSREMSVAVPNSTPSDQIVETEVPIDPASATGDIAISVETARPAPADSDDRAARSADQVSASDSPSAGDDVIAASERVRVEEAPADIVAPTDVATTVNGNDAAVPAASGEQDRVDVTETEQAVEAATHPRDDQELDEQEIENVNTAVAASLPDEFYHGGDDIDDDVDDDSRTNTTVEEDYDSKSRPVHFAYGFLQVFDEQKQDFIMRCDLIARVRENVHEVAKRLLGYPADKTILVWRRENAYHMTSIGEWATFEDMEEEESSPHVNSFVLVVGDALSDST